VQISVRAACGQAPNNVVLIMIQIFRGVVVIVVSAFVLTMSLTLAAERQPAR
jgi:hypothetical protein